MRTCAVHIEYPMFSRKMLCGRRGKGLFHTWASSKEAVKDVTCKACKSKLEQTCHLTRGVLQV